ncbi:MAG TPA: 50S ribosomal protein L11 methyltransferase [Gemmatimonadales bacterium]
MTESWWRLTITADPARTDAIAALVVAVTGNGVEETAESVVATTLETRPLAEALVARLEAEFAGTSVTMTATEPVDWATQWRDGIATHRFGRLILTPSWLPVAAGDAEIVVTIDPESAFGSGEHGSTRGALALLERHLRRGDRVLDFGSGSGVLAIAAVRLGARSAIGIEVDEQSNGIAEANACRNGVTSQVSFITGDANAIAPLAGPAELICSNILRTVNTALLPVIGRTLAPGGVVLFAGMEEPEEPLFAPVLAQHGFQVIDVVRDAHWWSVAARRQ